MFTIFQISKLICMLLFLSSEMCSLNYKTIVLCRFQEVEDGSLRLSL